MMSVARRGPVAQREAAAGALQLSVDLHLEWARDPSPRVRRAVAMRGDLAPDAARHLAQDRDRRVRELVAGNPRCPADVLMDLLDDDRFHVRWNAAQNPSATRQVHLAALRARHADVAEAVGQLGDTLDAEVIDALLEFAPAAARERLAEVTQSQALLERLARDPSPAVRGSVALSRHVSEDLLRVLGGDPRARVRTCVTLSGRAPRDLVLVLANDRSADVRWWASAGHANDREIAVLQADDPDALNRAQARFHRHELGSDDDGPT